MSTQPTIGLGLVVPRPCSARSMARRIAFTSEGDHTPAGSRALTRSPHRQVRYRGTKRRQANEATHKLARTARAPPPIRTFTVGPGVSPGQPAQVAGRTAGISRVADYHRRFGITPTPERTLLYRLSFARCWRTRRTRLRPRGDRPRWQTRSRPWRRPSSQWRPSRPRGSRRTGAAHWWPRPP